MRRATVAVLTLLAASQAGPLAAQVPIGEIRLTLDPVTYAGPCPVRLRAHVVFVSNYPARVDEDNWGWNFGRLAPHSWDVPGGHLRTSGRETAIDTTLTLPRAGATGLLHEGSVYVIMERNPSISNTVRYSVRCTPPISIDPNLVKPIQPGPTISLQRVPTLPPPAGAGGAAPAVLLPDLVPQILDPFAFRFAVRNAGDAPAGPSAVLLRCRAASGGGSTKGGCPSIPALAPLYDSSLGGFVVNVPAVPAGGTQPVPIPALGTIVWPTGGYEFTAVADVHHAVPERNEGNNSATRSVTR
jgi:hypothetical protein